MSKPLLKMVLWMAMEPSPTAVIMKKARGTLRESGMYPWYHWLQTIGKNVGRDR